MRTTRFTHPAAVDAWDQWFRWRELDCLHDRTIDVTWKRVAEAIAPPDDTRSSWVRRYLDAFSRWQVIPDERLLAGAGASTAMPDLQAPCALLNIGAYIIAPGTPQARLDEDRFVDTAALAVRLLDDAMLAAGARVASSNRLRIGLLGFADALDQLGMDYLDPGAPAFAARLGALLDHGTLRGMAELVRERGGQPLAPPHLQRLRARGSERDLVHRLEREGARHIALTAIESHPKLALLANGASDALAPRSGDDADVITASAVTAMQQRIHAAIAPWIDQPLHATTEG